ncbi:MAG TPA: nuclease-related domain-containing protein, partial [Microthrixaceae bacterium]|nr:nuclease-related domain-containing protein [Microthrixaceae bacterium]
MEKNTKKMKLRYAGTCTECGRTIAEGEWGIYVKDDKTVHCVEHEADSAVATPDMPKKSQTRRASSRPAKSLPGDSDEPIQRLIRVKFAGKCTGCSRELTEGVDAFYIPHSRVLVCPSCTAIEVSAGLGVAGASAGRVADSHARKQAERLLAAYPMIGEHLIENARPSAMMHRWDRGADGERVVGRELDRRVAAGDMAVLHDRLVPARGGNIDHIVVGPRRITVIDSKHYRGHKVRTPKRGGGRVLEIDEEPADHLVDGVLAQLRHVEDAVGQNLAGSVGAILAFVGADLGYLGQEQTRGVWCMSPRDAVVRAGFSKVLGKWPY